MRGYPGTGEEVFYDSPCETHIHLLLDVLIRYGVVHALHTDVVIILDCGNFPGCQLKRCGRER